MTTKTKFLSKTANKSILFSVIVAVLLVASIVISIVFGVNYSSRTDDATTLTVQMNQFFYNTEKDLDSVEDACKKEFAKQGLKVEYTYYDTRTTGDVRELVYVFENTAGVATKVQTAKENLKATVATNTAEGGIWHGATGMYVTTGSETVKTSIPASYTVKATIVAVVLSVIAGVYVAIRYNIRQGIVAFLAPIVGMVASASIILLTRIPLTTSVFYAIAVGGLLSETFTLLTLSKMRANADKEKGKELVLNNVAMKEMLVLSVALGIALILVGAIATWIVRWFALCALIALVCALYTGALFVPPILIPMQISHENAVEKKSVKYVGAKKKAENETQEVEQEQK